MPNPARADSYSARSNSNPSPSGTGADPLPSNPSQRIDVSVNTIRANTPQHPESPQVPVSTSARPRWSTWSGSGLPSQ